MYGVLLTLILDVPADIVEKQCDVSDAGLVKAESCVYGEHNSLLPRHKGLLRIADFIV